MFACLLHFASTGSEGVLFFWKAHPRCLQMEACRLWGWWKEDCPIGFWSRELQISELKHQSYKRQNSCRANKTNMLDDDLFWQWQTCINITLISCHSHVLGVLLSRISVGIPRWAHSIWRQTVYLQKKWQILSFAVGGFFFFSDVTNSLVISFVYLPGSVVSVHV